ncbi:MAG: GAF domain-containing protein [Clostridiales bacterium]|jgi:signal transduction histidine kinase|nr:GAF domain-containing sensor histidine kinase [Eubacteriales bacterium]MDH7567488.1 GAF domain-containing protein [Clostridiales bacterium]
MSSLHDINELTRINEELTREIAERERADARLEQRTQLLSTLLEVSNLVSSTMEIKPLMESILDRLKTIIDYKGAKIFVIEGEALKLMAHRSVLSAEEEMNYSFLYREIPLGREIIMGKKPVIISDVNGDTPHARMFREALGKYFETTLKYIRSWIGIPLVVKDRVIGVLTIDSGEPGAYLPRHIELGMAFANQAAIEFENARLYNETLKQSDELKTMLAVQQAITSRLDLDTVLKLIADESRRLTRCRSTAVFLVDGDELVFSVFSGEDQSGLIGYRVPVESSEMGRNLLLGKSVILKSAPAVPGANQDFIGGTEVRGYLSVPLIAGTKPVGVITATNKLEGEFNSEDERILSMFASSAVIGIENARMYQDERRRHQEDEQRRRVAEGLRDMLAILNSNRPLSDILDYIVNQAVRLVGTETGALYRLQNGGEVLTIEASCGLPAEYTAKTAVPVGEGAVGRAVMQRKPVVIDDMEDLVKKSIVMAPQLKEQFDWLLKYCNALVAVPLICKEEIYGGIVLYLKKSRSLSRDELDLLATYADQAALAIDNTRLRAQAQELAVAAERSRLARDLHDAVTQTLFSASLIAEVLPKIWERSREEGLKRLEELRQLTRGALAEMRTLLLELRPASLVEAGIGELLRHLSEATAGRARIPVSLEVEGCADIPTDVKIALYRIAQEALNNTVKHSGADRASIVLTGGKPPERQDTTLIRLIVSDNGRGFNPAGVNGDHLGLGIMRERAEAIGASFHIEGAPEEGTRITVEWRGKLPPSPQ